MNFTSITDTNQRAMQASWDSEKRNSPYSTVCDPNEDTYCEGCDSDYAADGTCKCGSHDKETEEEYYAAMASLGYKRAA